MKIHVGADVESGVVHTVSVTPANVADITELPKRLREDDRAVFGDAAYAYNPYKRAARRAGVYWGVALKARPTSRLESSQKQRNRKHASIRSRVEHSVRSVGKPIRRRSSAMIYEPNPEFFGPLNGKNDLMGLFRHETDCSEVP